MLALSEQHRHRGHNQPNALPPVQACLRHVAVHVRQQLVDAGAVEAADQGAEGESEGEREDSDGE